ncbi:MAG: FAD:protein FMN transferase [Patescibacteria group bacterium]
MDFTEKFKALGTEIIICAEIPQKKCGVFPNIKKIFYDFEKKFSRFQPASELSRMNQCSGKEFNASPLMIEIMRLAKTAHKKTSGIFNPAVLNILENLGYDKNFEDIGGINQNQPASAKIYTVKNSAFTGIKINKMAGKIKMPKGLRIDLGGIGKGFVVDLVSQKLKKYSANFWISAGGDMIFYGTNHGQKWRVGVQNPLRHENDIMEVEMPEKMPAIATSGITKRVWRQNGQAYHHIIDPRTSLPANNRLLAATVVAHNAWWADVLAKSALILGVEEGLKMINNEKNAEGVLIDSDLRMYFSDNMPKLAQI